MQAHEIVYETDLGERCALVEDTTAAHLAADALGGQLRDRSDNIPDFVIKNPDSGGNLSFLLDRGSVELARARQTPDLVVTLAEIVAATRRGTGHYFAFRTAHTKRGLAIVDPILGLHFSTRGRQLAKQGFRPDPTIVVNMNADGLVAGVGNHETHSVYLGIGSPNDGQPTLAQLTYQLASNWLSDGSDRHQVLNTAHAAAQGVDDVRMSPSTTIDDLIQTLNSN